MRKVIHLIPFHGIGGVETAARSVPDHQQDGLDFEVRTIFGDVPERRIKWKIYNPIRIFRCARRIAKESPDVLILSLWRAALVGILVHGMNRKVRLVLMIHNSVDAHFLDHVITRWVLAYCTEVWGDSDASVTNRFSSPIAKPVRTISFMVHRLSAPPPAAPGPVFIFWGRLSAQKNLDRAIRIFNQVHSEIPQARFLVIGPDGGELRRLTDLVRRLNVQDAVDFPGPMNLEEIRATALKASFYLQTSDFEGMAMSVVEGMQLGLVPIVTAVGEIANYCEHGKSAILVNDDDRVLEQVSHLLRNPGEYQAMRQTAISAWKETPTYAESILGETRRLLEGDENNL